MAKEIKKILCAVDLSDHSKEVAAYAVLLAKGLGASVLVVYTAPSLSQYVGFHVPPNTIENFVGEIVTGAEKSMEAFVAENFTGVEARGQVLIGYAAEEILNRAHDEKADIIVMDVKALIAFCLDLWRKKLLKTPICRYLQFVQPKLPNRQF